MSFQSVAVPAADWKAVRETSVSRHHGGTIEGLPKTPQTIVALSC